MILVAPRSARIVEERGSHFTLLAGYVFVLLGFVSMLLLWGENTPYWMVAVSYALVGIGIGLAGTPASRSLTGSVPVRRAGMASGTADLQRDLGGALFQSLFGALLAAGYAAAVSAAIVASGADRARSQQPSRTSSRCRMRVHRRSPREYPQYATQITATAKEAFLSGSQAAYVAGIIAVLGGMALVYLVFPKRDEERRILSEYHESDAQAGRSR